MQQQKIDSPALKEQQAAAAKAPAARFRAVWEAEIVRSEKNQGELEKFVVGLERDAADQDKRLAISTGVAYGSDIEKVSEILMQIASEDPDVLKEPAPSVVFMQHAESSLDFNLRVFIPSPSFINVLRDRLNKCINHEFAKHGIEIPFPQRDLHIRSNVIQA
jgi:small-conductance mechanosensitive channel